MEPPRRLTEKLIDDAVTAYRNSHLDTVHRRVRNISTVGFEARIAGLIRELLEMDQAVGS